ncbi:hypothetical protein NP493_263g00021 [Ridgeia piscesae]|uniref:Uncharacterized protein n=1 Tax=Ridgeia piscesae TaxID=27915 RepID=A0AAD9NXY5_RIDPI|nr:hypothetical protein NP493_263g00021 [Ridgeia piscesae]
MKRFTLIFDTPPNSTWCVSVYTSGVFVHFRCLCTLPVSLRLNRAVNFTANNVVVNHLHTHHQVEDIYLHVTVSVCCCIISAAPHILERLDINETLLLVLTAGISLLGAPVELGEII